MKNIILKLFCILFLSSSYAQQLLNGGFEQWEHVYTYQGGEMAFKPLNWTLYSESGQGTYYFGSQVVVSNVNNGKYSISIQDLGGSIFGKGIPAFLTYGNTVGRKYEVKPKKWGVPYTSRPSKVIGEYKFGNDRYVEDAGYGYILLKKYNINTQQSDTIGYGTYTFSINSTEITEFEPEGYMPFEMDIKYKDETTRPDTMVLVFVDSKYQDVSLNKYDAGFFFLDNISLVEDPSAVSIAHEPESTLTLYPNPANSVLSIKSNTSITKLAIYQSNGSKILESKATENLDVSTLPVGLYLLEVWDVEGNRFTRKFEKE